MSAFVRPSLSASLWLALASGLCPVAASSMSDAPDRPKLVILITVDQLRGDMLTRFEDRFEGGFKTLLDEGTLYTSAHYPYATTFTAVGHATLATGSFPIDHGIVGNNWWNIESGTEMYCVQDAHHGQSPANLTTTTLGDELMLATGGAARSFSISVKDRAAILPGGYYGKAFWYQRDGQFGWSTYYGADLPQWLQDFNARDIASDCVGESWELLRPVESYVFKSQDDRPYESGDRLGKTFPHPLGSSKSEVHALVKYTPYGDVLLAELAKALIEAEKLGQKDGTDFLAISFSASDYVGHTFGPNSLEAEDNLLRLDRTIGGLLTFLDESVGRDQILIALSADHGVDAIPAHRIAAREGHPPHIDLEVSACDDPCTMAGRIVGEELMRQANEYLKQQFQIDRELIIAFKDPGFYLDPKKTGELDVAVIERLLADWALSKHSIARAFTRTDLLMGNVPSDPVATRVVGSFHPERSANVTIVQRSGWYLWEGAGGIYAAMHGSPYNYDTHVPIVIFGAGTPKGRSARPVTPLDIAPTLANRLGILAPSGSSGEVLVESIPSRN
ncbi:MAG: alkaline phosphatase family protein [Planctomycetota bacterium]